jgi:hypothetical protein
VNVTYESSTLYRLKRLLSDQLDCLYREDKKQTILSIKRKQKMREIERDLITIGMKMYAPSENGETGIFYSQTHPVI